MTTDLREKIAEVLAGHRLGWRGSGIVNCECGWSFHYGRRPNDASAAHAGHVAEVILAVIGESQEEAPGTNSSSSKQPWST